MNPNRWTDRVVGWCFGILLGAFALYCVVKLLESIWPTLVVIVGAGAIIAGIIRAVVYYTTDKSW